MGKLKIDACGLPCPQPVVKTKNALEKIKEGIVEVIVDDLNASENVCKFAKSSGCSVEVIKKGGNYVIRIEKKHGSEVQSDKIVCGDLGNKNKKKDRIVIFIKSDKIGLGNDELGVILMRVFFPTIMEVEPKPTTIIFMNNGVKLTVEGSQHLENLIELGKKNIEMLVCGTCLDFFHIKEKVKVGRISNFFEISENLLRADKVISF